VSIESTRDVITKYLNSKHSDMSVLAPDVVFTHMANGQEHRGPDAVMQMLNYMYQQAFAADAEIGNLVFADGQAVLEADFVGIHIGEFAGIPATHKSVRVPFCVVYDLKNDRITRARVYFEMPVMMQQLGAG